MTDYRNTYPHADAEMVFRRALDECSKGNHKPDELGNCSVCGIERKNRDKNEQRK